MSNRYALSMLIIAGVCCVAAGILGGCAMSEEVRRINENKRVQQSRDAARSTKFPRCALHVGYQR